MYRNCAANGTEPEQSSSCHQSKRAPSSGSMTPARDGQINICARDHSDPTIPSRLHDAMTNPENDVKQPTHHQDDSPGARLQDVLLRNRQSGKGGVYAVCSAHPDVIAASIQQAIADDSVLHVESTSSQVNQF